MSSTETYHVFPQPLLQTSVSPLILLCCRAGTGSQTTATAKACYICYKPTTTVLATIDTTDFLYSCPVHLTDPGFANRVADENDKKAVSAEEIARIKEEWEEKQKNRKAEKEKAEKEKAEKEKEGKDKDEGKKDESKASAEDKGKDLDKKPNSTPGSFTLSGSSSPKPTHERYSLHRDIFALRVSEHRKRRQAAQAKDLAPRLPSIPRGL